MISISRTLVVVSLAGSLAPPGYAQDAADDAVGIPVTDPIVRRACGGCHAADADGRMTRISYQRTTPEGWQQTIRRMVLLNGLQIEPADAREAVRYLANVHGLAPEEARPALFEVERRLIDHVYEADPETQETCTKCHSLGRVLSQRRTREEWQLLTAMHQGFYPLTDFQSFLQPRSALDPDDPRQPVEKAVDHLAAAFPLETAEWSAWRDTMRPPRLTGTWRLVGHARGQGPVYGQLVVTAVDGTEDQFRTETTYVHARTGETVTRSGQAVVYTGFQWRGRSTTPDGESLREVLFVEPDWSEMSGRWFTGDHDEIGLDVTLHRAGDGPVVSGTWPAAVSTTASSSSLTLFGVNLPADLSADAIDLGTGVTVTDVTALTDTRVRVSVAVAEDAPSGRRSLVVADRVQPAMLAVYDTIDRLEVVPDTGMARVGGVAFPRRYEQFEARGYHRGPDGRPGTEDDVALGMVDAEWTLEEYAVTFGDDDVAFVGTLDERGFFTPNIDGPNPDRLNNGNNIGDVWVVARVNEGVGRPLRARAHLLVTVPLYIRRDGQIEEAAP